MANVKAIIAAHLSQRQRQINQEVERVELLGEDRLLCNIIRVAGDINVPDRPAFVWCQEYSPSDDTSPFHAFNDKVQAREGLTVWIGEGLGGRREVLDWNNATIINTPDYNAQKYLPVHHLDHEWPDFKPGPDVVNVYPRSLSMLRTYPGEGGALTVSASPLRYIKGNALVVFPGTISMDISASQPASGLARFVGIYLDPDDNTLKTVNGATTSDSPAITPDSPAFPESAILSANVRLDGDQTTFSEVDIVDARQILDASGAIDGTRVSKLVSPDGALDPIVSVDNLGNVVVLAGLSGVVTFQPTTDSTTFLQILDADGGTPILNVDSTNERVGVGTASPAVSLQVGDGTPLLLGGANNVIAAGPDTFSGRLYAEGTGQASVILVDSGAAVDEKMMQLVNIDTVTKFRTLTDAGALGVDNILVMDHSNGDVGIGTASPSARLHVIDEDAVTAAITDIETLGHNSTGTPAVNFGAGFLYQLESSTTINQDAARISALWATATHATRKARSVWSVFDTAEREGVRIEASGTAPMLGFYGVTAVVRPTALTSPLTQITHTGPAVPDFAIATPIDSGVGSAWGFSTQDEFETIMSVILNLQTRLDEAETKLQSLGLLT